MRVEQTFVSSSFLPPTSVLKPQPLPSIRATNRPPSPISLLISISSSQPNEPTQTPDASCLIEEVKKREKSKKKRDFCAHCHRHPQPRHITVDHLAKDQLDIVAKFEKLNLSRLESHLDKPKKAKASDAKRGEADSTFFSKADKGKQKKPSKRRTKLKKPKEKRIATQKAIDSLDDYYQIVKRPLKLVDFMTELKIDKGEEEDEDSLPVDSGQVILVTYDMLMREEYTKKATSESCQMDV
ncbi:hypothetical protein M5K25_027842 [Dendrobium thyrsiflorum]|uniref:Uncharacterized protein n=1 Tax=Dendrobium thyrsiflorum TaxID=117978 RepID=A0ABD0TUV5_DENTH